MAAGLLPVSAHRYGVLRVIEHTNMVLPPSWAAGLPEEAAEDKSTAIALSCNVTCLKVQQILHQLQRAHT